MIRLQRAVLALVGFVVLGAGVAICLVAWLVEDYAICLNLFVREVCNIPAPPLAALITLAIGLTLIVAALRLEDDEGEDLLDEIESRGIRVRYRGPR